jgi:chromosome segregation ATPase
MFATLADGEDLAARREKDLAQLREALGAAARTETELNGRLGTVLAERSRLEVRLAESAQKLSRAQAEDSGEASPNAVARLAADRRRLEERLAIVTRQNQKLREDLAARDGEVQPRPSGQDRAANAVLREQIAQIAAEMVHLVEALEGPDSPIRKVVPAVDGASHPPGDGTPSLADRIRALRAAAATS